MCAFMCILAARCVCMYDYHIAVSIKALSPFEIVCVCACVVETIDNYIFFLCSVIISSFMLLHTLEELYY